MKARTHRVSLVLLTALLAAGAFGQQSAPLPQFDVASIKPNQTPQGRGLASLREDINTSPGSLTMRNVSLTTAVRWAYQLNPFQVSGPDWLGTERFDILAKADNPVPESQLRVMLQALLADRFKLTFHRQAKDLAGYALVSTKNVSKLHPVEGAAGGEGSMTGSALVFEGHAMPMSRLADILSGVVRLPVFDMTGLDGHYDFTLDMRPYITPRQPGDPPMDLVSIAIAGLQEIGLKLESHKSSVDVFVIDHAEKVPAEN